MNDLQKLVRLAVVARAVIEAHNTAASEMEPGFTCGCKTVCQPLLNALEEVGLIEDQRRGGKS